MSRIKYLSETTIQRIAAGEVIERPASAMKELVDNALDAGASRIDVVLHQGGKNLISVSDNGSGMLPEELEMAVERHTTSKLDENDLMDIRHFGFRGEALPSIGSVSRMEIISRHLTADQAWSIKVEGGAKYPVTPASHAQGTLIKIRDLFFAVPARLKFLKSEQTELQHATDMLSRLAMIHPHVNFSLQSERKTLLKLTARLQAEPLEALAHRIEEILGTEFMQNSVPINAVQEDLKLTGFVSLPTYHRATGREQYLFVNQRPIKDKLLTAALKAAYYDLMPKDRHSVVVLSLEMPIREVDVNVHPAKAEVRFRDVQLIRRFITQAIHSALSKITHRVSTVPSHQMMTALASSVTPMALAAPKAQFSHAEYSARAQGMGNRGATSFKHSDATIVNHTETHYRAPTSSLFKEEATPMAKPLAVDHTLADLDMDYPLGAARCQLYETYIVSQTKESIIIVDQHAAHERLVYEKMKQEKALSQVKRQALLIPEILTVKADEMELLLENNETLRSLGLIIDRFGESEVIVREVPALLGHFNIVQLVKDLIEELKECGSHIPLQEAIEHVCETIACHSSIRAGKQMTMQEMNRLLREMEETPYSGQCNHGRPTYVELKRSDIEKFFGRKG